MDYKAKMKDFNKRWNIEESFSEDLEFNRFKNRVLNLMEKVDRVVTDEGKALFCRVLGVPVRKSSGLFNQVNLGDDIIHSLESATTVQRLCFLLELIFTLPFRRLDSYTRLPVEPELKDLVHGLDEILNLSNVNVKLKIQNDEALLIPSGEQSLDSELVDKVLSFTDRKSESHLVSALKYHMKKDTKSSIKSAESLRRALEEFLKFKMKNNKGLKANIDELFKKLKDDGRDPKIRNIICQTFAYLDDYFNENSKHEDGNIDEAENEFLIYQTCLLMRYLNDALN